MSEKKSSPLGVLFLTLFVDLMGFSIIFPLFPEMLDHYLGVEEEGGFLYRLRDFLESFATGDEESKPLFTAVLFGGLLGSIYSTLQFIFSPIWGGLSDRIGRKPVLLFSISGTALSYLLWMFSGSFWLLIVSRILGGCMAGNISTATAAMADATSRENRAKGMGIIGAAFGLGFILGPAIGAGTHSSFDAVAAFPGLVDYGWNPFSGAATAAFLLSLLNVVWVLTRFRETLSESDRERARNTKRPIHPVFLVRKLNIPEVNLAYWAYFLFLVAFAGVEFTLTFFVYDRFDYRSRDIMWIFIFSGLIIALVQGGVVRRMAPKYGERNLALTGLVSLIPGFFIIAFSPPSQFMLYFGLFFVAAGSALAIPCMTSLVSLYTPTDQQGAVLGVFRSLGALSRAIGPLIFCSIYWKFGQIWPYVTGGLLLVVPILMTVKLPQPEKGPADIPE